MATIGFVPEPQGREPRTVLEALLWRRDLTREATLRVLDARAEEIDEPNFALGLRQLDRLLAGEVGPRSVRKPTRRVLRAEFGLPPETLLASPDRLPPGAVTAAARSRGVGRRALRTAELVGWLAEHGDASLAAVYDLVADAAEQLAARTPAEEAASAYARSTVTRAQVADAVYGRYGSLGSGFYQATVAGTLLRLTVHTKASWVGLDVPLDPGHEHVTLRSIGDEAACGITAPVFAAAVARLARVEVTDTVLTDNPLYRLVDISVEPGRLAATFALTRFAAYALTVDLMERELIDSLVRHHGQAVDLPIRDLYLPTLASAVDYERRICAGGVVCLLAVAREDDYLLFIQERSARVANATGRLAVVPKAFHQPLTDLSTPALSATLQRELEEELLGRDELDHLSPETRRHIAADHVSAASAPVRWLHAHRDSYLLRCTGVGINMLSGNYEVACLAVIDDPAWWADHAGSLLTNWEIDRTRVYSTRDTQGLTGLIGDPRWSDEGLFALLEGLRFLAHHRPQQMNLPDIEVTW